MKKTLFIVLLVLMVLVVSCKNEIDSDLIGSWIYESYDTYTFGEDGRFEEVLTYSSGTEKVYGTWTTSDGILRLEYDVSSINRYSTFSADNPVYYSINSESGVCLWYSYDLNADGWTQRYRSEELSYDGKKYVYEKKDDLVYDYYMVELSDSGIVITEEYENKTLGGDKTQIRLIGSKVPGYSGTNVYKITKAQYSYYVEAFNYSVDGRTLKKGAAKYTKL